MRNVLVLLSIMVLSSCVSSPEPIVIICGPCYERPEEFRDSTYHTIFAIKDVDSQEFEKAKANGTAICIEVINGQTYYSVESGFEVDCPENGTVEWVTALERYRVKK